MTDTIPAWEDPRKVLARHGLKPKRGFSQNFLVSRSAVERIVEALAPSSGELVIELGPGLGTLTGALLRAGARVHALDADRDMLDVLHKELGHVAELRTTLGDATELDIVALAGNEGRIKVAGNLPYAVTGAIFRRLVSERAHVDRAVVMVQREVRDRLLAEPGTKQYGALSVFTRAAFDASPVCIVPAGAFHPPPRVDSAVVALHPARAPVDPGGPGFERTVRAAFEARRKTLRNALQLAYPVASIDAALSELALDGQRRGETLTLPEFAALAAALDRAARAGA